jgi:hypothetical protein
MNATDRNGRLKRISDECYLQIGSFTLFFNNLPEIGDSKSASYNDEAVIGRAVPIKTYANSDNRSISCSITLVVQKKSDCFDNITILRNIQSAVYPRNDPGAPYFPPVICRLKVGNLLSNDAICCVMKEYNVKFPTDVPWDIDTLCPYKMEVGMTFEQVYSSSKLPNRDLILSDYPLGGGDGYSHDCNGLTPLCLYPPFIKPSKNLKAA